MSVLHRVFILFFFHHTQPDFFFFFSQLQNLSLMGINFIFHLVTALILGLNHSKFRQALEKTLFLSPLISPATPCQPYR